jgi:hypothetical protein
MTQKCYPKADLSQGIISARQYHPSIQFSCVLRAYNKEDNGLNWTDFADEFVTLAVVVPPMIDTLPRTQQVNRRINQSMLELYSNTLE